MPAKDAPDSSAAAAPRTPGECFQTLYQELRRRARGELFRHQALSLGATSLLQPGWLQLDGRPLELATQTELVACAGRAMRGIVVDHIRARQSDGPAGGAMDVPYETLIDLDCLPDREVLSLNDALAALAGTEPPLAELVELKFFGGLSFAEIAALRGVSERSVQLDWDKARLLLFAALRE